MSNDSHALTAGNILATLPRPLQQDESTQALGAATAELLASRLSEIDKLKIMSAIDEADEDLLDILANDFKVDWWNEGYPIERKREILKNSWKIHKMIGTKAALELAVSNAYGSSKITEWFEYDGEPGRFRVLVDTGEEGTQRDALERLLHLIDLAKNLRSHLDDIRVQESKSGSCKVYYAGIAAADEKVQITLDPDLSDKDFLVDEDGFYMETENGDLLYEKVTSE